MPPDALSLSPPHRPASSPAEPPGLPFEAAPEAAPAPAAAGMSALSSLCQFLVRCEQDVRARAPAPSLFSLFEQRKLREAQVQYCAVWWVSTDSAWLVYPSEDAPYQIAAHDNADVAAFLRDLRLHHLATGVHAVAAYRARLLR